MITNVAPDFTDIHTVDDAPESTWIYEHGWQSWSPAGVYRGDALASPRPKKDIWQTMAFRPEIAPPHAGFQGEGLLGVVHQDGSAVAFFATHPDREVPSIRVRTHGGRLIVSANGPVGTVRACSLDDALTQVGSAYASLVRRPLQALPAGWCSWYTYWADVTAQDILDNLAVIIERELPIEVVQIDDGYQSDIGDWLEWRPGFGDLGDVVDRILDAGKIPGLWTTPFLVGVNSQIARRHPDWLVDGAVACEHHWGQQIRVLDVTHPAVEEHLVHVYRTFASMGIGFHKIDFTYGGAMVGGRRGDLTPIEAYRRGLELVRAGAGEEAVILGCGAPLLPSIGLVDAMRISPDVMPQWEPDLGDISQPAMRSALAAGRPRAWMHGRVWVNDPDCVLVRPEVDRPGPWREYIEVLRGLAVSSDPLVELGDADLEQTRALMAPADLTPVSWDPWAGPDQGLIHRYPNSS